MIVSFSLGEKILLENNWVGMECLNIFRTAGSKRKAGSIVHVEGKLLRYLVREVVGGVILLITLNERTTHNKLAEVRFLEVDGAGEVGSVAVTHFLQKYNYKR